MKVNKHRFDCDTVNQNIVRDTRMPYLKILEAQNTQFQKKTISNLISGMVAKNRNLITKNDY